MKWLSDHQIAESLALRVTIYDATIIQSNTATLCLFARLALPALGNGDVPLVANGNHVVAGKAEGNVPDGALEFGNVQGKVGLDDSKDIADIVAFGMRGPGPRTRPPNRQGTHPGCGGGGGATTTSATLSVVVGGVVVLLVVVIIVQPAAPAVFLNRCQIPEEDLAVDVAHGQDGVHVWVGEEAKAQEEGVRVRRGELHDAFKGPAKGRARVAVFVRGGRLLVRRGGFFGIEVLDQPEHHLVLLGGPRQDEIAMKGDAADRRKVSQSTGCWSEGKGGGSHQST